MIKITDTVKHLIIINVIMFVGTLTIGNGELFYKWFALYFPEGALFKPWQVITHMFMHGGFTHLLFNMLGVWMFGSAVEQVLGSKRFLFLYFSAGLGAVLFQLGYYYIDYLPSLNTVIDAGFPNDLIDKINGLNILERNSEGQSYFDSNILRSELIRLLPEYNIDMSSISNSVYNSIYDMNVTANNNSMVGASGCLMGVLVAFGIMNPNAELMLIFFPVPIKAKYFIPLLLGYDIVSGFLGGVSIFGMNTAHWAHVGGAFVGLIIMLFWKKNQFNKYRIE